MIDNKVLLVHVYAFSQIKEDKDAQALRLAADNETEDGYTPMLPATLAKSLPPPAPESVESLGMADLRKILRTYSTSSTFDQVQFKDDMQWLRKQVLCIWEEQHTLLNSPSDSSAPEMESSSTVVAADNQSAVAKSPSAGDRPQTPE